MNNYYIRYVSIIFALLFWIESANGQTTFIGSEVPLDNAVKQSDVIFIGQIEEIGPAVIKALGEKSYYGVRVNVVKVLSGEVASEVTVSLNAKIGEKIHEITPETKTAYVFFVKRKAVGSKFHVLKLLAADDALILKIKVLIAATSTLTK